MATPTVTAHSSLVDDEAPPITISRWALQEGEEIPLHDHNRSPNSAHVSICASGVARFEFDDGSERVVSAGELYDCSQNEQKHRVVAMAPNTVVFNIVKG
jgi:quercetin dioxygenase-like cupin family protein